MKIVITGGGTGGHIYPGLSVGLELIENGWEQLYIGSVDGLEADIIPKNGLKFKSVSVAPLPRKLNLSLFTSIFKNCKGFFQARKILADFKPDIVLGTGGFVAGAVVSAAAVMGIPTIIHEQNVYPGITNRLLSRMVDKIALNFSDARDYFSDNVFEKTVVTGNPIRKIILEIDSDTGLEKLGLDSTKKTLLVFGGSQGSASINEAMFDIYDYFIKNNNVQIIHITGEKNYKSYINEFEEKYNINIKQINHINIMPYLENIEWAYAVANLIVYRAGATGLAEITAKGLPAILIPYPYAAGDHQLYNARMMEEHGAAVMIREKELTGASLLKKIEEILFDKSRLKKMGKNSFELGQPEARTKIINEINKLS